MRQERVSLKANVTTVTLTPLARFARTFTQVLIALGAAVPIVLNSPAVAGSAVLFKDVGIAGGLIVIITALWNSLENYGVIPVVGGKPASEIEPTIAALSIKGPQVLPDLYALDKK